MRLYSVSGMIVNLNYVIAVSEVKKGIGLTDYPDIYFEVYFAENMLRVGVDIEYRDTYLMEDGSHLERLDAQYGDKKLSMQEEYEMSVYKEFIDAWGGPGTFEEMVTVK